MKMYGLDVEEMYAIIGIQRVGKMAHHLPMKIGPIMNHPEKQINEVLLLTTKNGNQDGTTVKKNIYVLSRVLSTLTKLFKLLFNRCPFIKPKPHRQSDGYDSRLRLQQLFVFYPRNRITICEKTNIGVHYNIPPVEKMGETDSHYVLKMKNPFSPSTGASEQGHSPMTSAGFDSSRKFR